PWCDPKGGRSDRSVRYAHPYIAADGCCCGSLRYLCFCKAPIDRLSLPSHHVRVLRLRAAAPSVPGGIPGHDGALDLFGPLCQSIHQKTWRKIMRNLKRVWTLFLALALVLSLCAPAYAAVEDTGFSDVE